MKSIKYILFFLFFLSATVKAQDKSNRGKEFWLAYGFDYTFFNEAPVNSQDLAIYISAIEAATVTVTVTNTGYTQTLSIPANTVNATIIIPKSGANDARTLTDGLQNRNVHIVSNVVVAVYAHVYATQVSGATMLMPVETYGYEYYSINYYQTTSQSSPNDWYSWFYVVASEDNTSIQITPSDTTKNGWLPASNNVITLNKGESYHVFGKAIFNGDPAKASKDMTGSKVISVPGSDGRCHPIALFSGSGGIRLCRGDGGEFMQQQVFPAQAWGTRYLTYHTINNGNTNITETNRNICRICVSDPTTVVKKNGVVQTGLIKNFFYEYMDSTGGDYIEADKPILVAQFTVNKNQCWNNVSSPTPSYGDPEMFYLSPIEQGQKSVLFYVSRKSTIDYVYANIHLPTNAVPSLRVDGAVVPAAQIIPQPNFPSYSVALVRFIGAAAQHRIVADSAFNATVYGLGSFESYGYNVGTLINNLNNYSAISNVNNTNGQLDTFTCKNTPVRLFLKLAYPATSITWKLSQIAGMMPNVDSVQSAPLPIRTELINGRTYYVYTLQQNFTFGNNGTFFIPVTYTSNIITNCSQSEDAVVKIVVKPGPISDFTTTGGACLSVPVQFAGTPTTTGFNITGYNWFFDDNTTATGINAIKQFAVGGNHDVRFQIIADNGCVADTIKTVAVAPGPIAKLGITPAGICIGDSVLVSDTSSIANGTLTNWRYDFGEGTVINRNNGNSFYHTFAAAGSFSVKLVVTSASNCVSDTSRMIVNVAPKPTASFTISGNACLGTNVTLTDNSVTGSPVAISQWKWMYGDGVTEIKTSAVPFAHNYTTAGTFIIKLVTSGSGACFSDTARQTVTISPKPSADFTIAGKPCVDSLQQFTSATSPIVGVATTWFWEFGDGSVFNSTSSAQATHSYSNAITNVTVRHWVRQDNCLSDTITRSIPLIGTNPSAVFTLQPTSICVAEDVVFTSSSSTNNSFVWDFGNGIGNQVPSFTRKYLAAGDFVVKLQTISPEGCGSTTAMQNLKVNPKPIVNAGADILKKEADLVSLQGSASISLGSLQYTWMPPSFLSSTTILNPISSTPNDMVYALTARDIVSGCNATDSVSVKIVTDLFIPNAFSPGGNNKLWRIPSLVLFAKAQVTVFNRYGQKVYTSNGPNVSWNGRFQGFDQPQGAYIYIINFNDPTQKDLKGTLMLLR